MSTHKLEPWMEAAAKACIDLTLIGQPERHGKLLRSWQPDFAEIIARHAPAQDAVSETGCDKCGDKRCKALLRLRAALAAVEKER